MALEFAAPFVGRNRAAAAWLHWLHIRAEDIINLRRGAVCVLADELLVRGEFGRRDTRRRAEQAIQRASEIARLADASAQTAREQRAGVVPIRKRSEEEK